MAEADALAIVNEALLLCGERTLSSLEGSTAAHEVASTFYQPEVDAALGSHPWAFNRRVEALTRLVLTPPAATGYSAAYQRPPLCFRLVRIFLDSMSADSWGEAGDVIYITAQTSEQVTIEYHTRVDEQLWRPAFRQAMVNRLAAAMCLPLTENEARTKLLAAVAEQRMAMARNLNAQERGAIRLPVMNLQRRRAR